MIWREYGGNKNNKSFLECRNKTNDMGFDGYGEYMEYEEGFGEDRGMMGKIIVIIKGMRRIVSWLNLTRKFKGINIMV